MPSQPPRSPAEYSLRYRVCFSFKHEAVLHCIEEDYKSKKAKLLANKDWEMVSSGDYYESWVEFASDEPFDKAELDRTLANIELLDAACEAMTNGTPAEAKSAAFKE